MKKTININKRKGKMPFNPIIGVCPYHRGRNFVGSNRNWFHRLIYGGFYCKKCRKYFRRPYIAKLATK